MQDAVTHKSQTPPADTGSGTGRPLQANSMTIPQWRTCHTAGQTQPLKPRRKLQRPGPREGAAYHTQIPCGICHPVPLHCRASAGQVGGSNRRGRAGKSVRALRPRFGGVRRSKRTKPEKGAGLSCPDTRYQARRK